MVMGNSWANPVATKRSFELIAQHVMPEFQGSNKSMLRAVDRALAKHDAAYAKQEVALSEMKARHERERLARQS
jgi:limonene 1,2-monooxygenase